MKNTATKGKTDKIDFIKIKDLYALKVKVKSLSRVRLFATPWGVAHQVSPSMGFSRQEYWSGLLFPSPGDLLNPGIKPTSPAWQADSSSESLRNNFNFNPLSGK